MKKIFASIFAMLSLGFAAPAFAQDSASPSFPGGDEALSAFIAENMHYPAIAADNGIEGTVDVAFTVKTDGSIGAIKIVRMIDPDLEQEAIRIVKIMPAWIPAQKAGKPVEAPAAVKIPFRL